jgi:hypothetical protein
LLWLKVPQAIKAWSDSNVSEKTVYAAIRKGRLRVARIGAGRNFLLCESFWDEWLLKLSDEDRAK